MKMSRRLSQMLTGALLATAMILIAACQKGRGEIPVTIALISDFGTKDAYVGQMKASILAVYPNARLLDLTHDLKAFDVDHGSYLVDKASKYFGAGTIFVVVVDPGVGGDRKPMLLTTGQGKSYIGPNNGIFTRIISREKLDKAYELDQTEFHRSGITSATFHGRDIFGPVAGHLAAGKSADSLGTEMKTSAVERLDIKLPTNLGDRINASVAHVDHYGNIITNIPSDFISTEVDNRLVKILHNGKTYSAPLVRTYADAPKERLILLVNSEGEVEIALPEGSAVDVIQTKVGEDIVLIQ